VIDQLVIGFDGPVSATIGNLIMIGVDSGLVSPVAIVGAPGEVVTWTMTSTGRYLAADRYMVALDSVVTDAAGNVLVGGWLGDLNVAVGDVNGDGRVSSLDRRDLRDAYGSVPGDANYTLFADVNGDGRISSRDRRALRDHYGSALPDADAAPIPAPTADAPPAAPTESDTDTDATLTPVPLVIVHVPSLDVSTTAPTAQSPPSSAPSPLVSEGADVPSASQLEPDLSSGLTSPLE